MSLYCATMCLVTVKISMAIPALPTHLWGETTGHEWVVPTKLSDVGLCVCFVVSLNSLLDKQSSFPWLKSQMTFHCIDYFSFLKYCQANGLILQNILKMLIAWQHKLHWLSWISILPFKDGKLFMINLSSTMSADNRSIESTKAIIKSTM